MTSMKLLFSFQLCCLAAAAVSTGQAQSTTFTDGTAFTNAANALLSYDRKATTVDLHDLLRYPQDSASLPQPATFSAVMVGSGSPPSYLSTVSFASGGHENLAANADPRLHGPVVGQLDGGGL